MVGRRGREENRGGKGRPPRCLLSDAALGAAQLLPGVILEEVIASCRRRGRAGVCEVVLLLADAEGHLVCAELRQEVGAVLIQAHEIGRGEAYLVHRVAEQGVASSRA